MVKKKQFNYHLIKFLDILLICFKNDFTKENKANRSMKIIFYRKLVIVLAKKASSLLIYRDDFSLQYLSLKICFLIKT